MRTRRIVPNIPSTDLEKSKLFYVDFIGLKLAMDMNWIMTFISESNPTAQVTIVKKDGPPIINSDITITIEVQDVDELHEKAVLLKHEIIYPITNEPWGVRRFFVKDPNGVSINLMSHLKNIENKVSS